MPEAVNLADKMKAQLPAELADFIRMAGEAAQRRGMKLYLIGGVVRDLLLGRRNIDLDLVVEGDAIALADELAAMKQGKAVKHPHFGTAKVQWDNWSVDIATARSESYARPGALPKVRTGSIGDDLFRRDFAINAMAVELIPDRYGELLDPCGGRDDLERGLVRVLHEKSFVDDATRIWRALRYEQRLKFRLEPRTLRLLRRDIAMLDTVSGDRIRHELELVLKEELPEKMLRRADELGVLQRLHPSLKGDDWLAEKFRQVREITAHDMPALYLALLAYRLNEVEAEALLSYLRLPRSTVRILRDAVAVKSAIGQLSIPGLSPSSIYRLLQGYDSLALLANSLAADSPVAAKHIHLFLNVLRHVKPGLTGEDLKKMGVAPGPRVSKLLDLLREARLDGKVSSRKGEEGLVEEWLAQEEA